MEPKRIVEYQGRNVEGQPVSFATTREDWNEYAFEDGSVLRMKTILLEVVRLDEYSDDGDPIYQFKAHQIMGIRAADALKKKRE